MPDAKKFGDAGADTVGNIFKSVGRDFRLPNLAGLGLYNLLSTPPGQLTAPLRGSYGRMACASPAKDTTAGHWELSGIILDKPFPTYPFGFPTELIAEFEKRIGTKTLGNCAASGTEIIKRLGDEHCRTGYPIVYTSADSVFQIAAHESVFGLERLYGVSRTAREMLKGEHAVGRVIARPFIGSNGNYARTENRRDFSLSPAEDTVLDKLKRSGREVVAVGKIEDIFNSRGITRAIHSHNNASGMTATLDLVNREPPEAGQLIFANLVDFDMLWGHRRDARGYANGLKEFDDFLPSLETAMRDDDLLIITADHGCDPTYLKHTDHTREYVPLLIYGKKINKGVNLGTRGTFADVAQTIAEIFQLPAMRRGAGFAAELGAA
jgi:phosphopentomutase